MPLRVVAAAVVAGHILYALAPPLLSADVFGYIGYARLGGVHGLDPYLHAVEAIPDDAINTYLSTIWPTDLKSPYGPLFLLGTSR